MPPEGTLGPSKHFCLCFFGLCVNVGRPPVAPSSNLQKATLKKRPFPRMQCAQALPVPIIAPCISCKTHHCTHTHTHTHQDQNSMFPPRIAANIPAATTRGDIPCNHLIHLIYRGLRRKRGHVRLASTFPRLPKSAWEGCLKAKRLISVE